MRATDELGDKAVATVGGALARSLRIRGFFGRPEGFSRGCGDHAQLVRLEVEAAAGGHRAALGVRLSVLRVAGMAPVADPDLGGARGRVEVSLWDLIPGRDPGGAWVVTRESGLGAVAADLVGAMERWGLPHLDALVADPEARRAARRRRQPRWLRRPAGLPAPGS